MAEDKTITEQDIKKVEADLLAKKQATEEAEKARIRSLLEEAEKKGQAEAMKRFEDEQAKKRLEEELAAVKQRAASIEEETRRQVEEQAKKFTEEIEKLKSERKGIVKNESPFAKSQTDSTPQLTPDQLREIDRRSAEEFARAHGFSFRD